MSIKLSKEDIKNKFKKKGLTLLNVNDYKTNKTKLTAVDKDGYYYYINLNNLNKTALNIKSKISKGNPYSLKNINNYLKINNIKTQAIDVCWVNGHSAVYFKCKCGNEFCYPTERISKIKHNRFVCEECRKKIPSSKKYSFNYVKEKLKENGYELLDNYYKGNNDNLTCKDKEGYIVKVKFATILNGYNKKPYRFSVVFNLENYLYNINHYCKINDINCKAISYDLHSEKYGENTPITCICECGNEFITTFSAIKNGNYRCQECTKYKSNLEKKAENWLISKHIEYVCQKTFEECRDKRKLPFDFYLPKYNCCIEIDGDQHDKIVNFGDSTKEELEKQFEKRKLHDKIKNEYCIKNNIKLIRIPQNKIENRHEEYKKILYDNLIKK